MSSIIKNYKSFLENNQNDKLVISNWLDGRNVKNYTINDDLTIDVDGDVDISSRVLVDGYKWTYGVSESKCLYEIPYKFGKVNGLFSCAFNRIESLKNCPYYVGKIFDASYNNIQNLNFLPNYIKDEIYLRHNKIKSMNDFPIQLFEHIYCLDLSNNNILDLANYPYKHMGKINLYENPIDNFINCIIPSHFLKPSNLDHNYYLKQKSLLFNYLQEYNVIDGNTIFLDRLDDVIYMIDLEIDKEKVIESIRKLDSYKVI